MGFLRKQQIKAAARLLAWQYEKKGHPLPERKILVQHACRLVDDAHRIAKERGGNVLGIVKEMVGNIKKN